MGQCFHNIYNFILSQLCHICDYIFYLVIHAWCLNCNCWSFTLDKGTYACFGIRNCIYCTHTVEDRNVSPHTPKSLILLYSHSAMSQPIRLLHLLYNITVQYNVKSYILRCSALVHVQAVICVIKRHCGLCPRLKARQTQWPRSAQYEALLRQSQP